MPPTGTTLASGPEIDQRIFRPDWRTVLTIALGVLIGVLLLDGARAVIGKLQGLLTVVLFSLFLSFAIEPAVQYLARRGIRRGLGTLLVFLLVALLTIAFVAAMAPLMADQISNLVDSGPSLIDDLAVQAERLPGDLGNSVSGWLEDVRTELPDRLPEVAGRIGGGLLDFGSTLLGGLLQALTVLLLTFYLVADGPRMRRALIGRLRPERQRDVLTVWELAITKTGGYVYSRVLIAVASAAFHIAAFWLIGVGYPVALGAWVGVVSSLIPVVGTYIAGLLPVLVALGDEPIRAIWVLIVVVFYQQIENYLVSPRIAAHTMELHPAIAFVSVLAGAALLGAIGALIALPVAAITAAVISAAGERHETLAHELLDEVEAEGDAEKPVRLGSRPPGPPR
jgi:predicted PurR-regulated permease PerM